MPAVDNDDKRQNRAPVLKAATVNLKDKHSKYEKLDKTAHQVLANTDPSNLSNLCKTVHY